MFVVIFQFTEYEMGDENLNIENNFTTNTYEKPIVLSQDFMYQTSILGQKQTNNLNKIKVLVNKKGQVKKQIIFK